VSGNSSAKPERRAVTDAAYTGEYVGSESDTREGMKPCSLYLQFDLKTEEVLRSELLFGQKKRKRPQVKKSAKMVMGSADVDYRSKAFHQNLCHIAGGKCERCKSTDCSDRDWRKRGMDAP